MNHNPPSIAFMDFADTATIQEIFQRELPEFSTGRLTILDCKILHTHTKLYLEAETAHKSFFVACYRLMVVDEQTQRRGEQLIYARAYLHGRSRKKFQKIEHGKLYPPRFGAPVVHLPALDMIVWGFPNDPDLPHLPLIVDPARVRHYLPLGELELANLDIANGEIAIEVVRYKPGKRCTLRYEVWGEDGSDQSLQLYGKMLADETAVSTYRQLTALWEHSLCEPRSFGIAQPLGYEPRLRLLWQAAVPGTRLLQTLCESNEERLIAAMAQGLAELHNTPLSPSPRQEIGHHLAAAQEQSGELTKAYPHFEGLLHTLTTTIEQNAPQLSQDQERPIHRDFHVEQLLVHEQRLFMFDFDDLSMGDPMQDLAFFMVDLHYRKLDPARVKRITTALCQAYQDASAAPLPTERLNWHIQVQFLAKAYWFFKKRQQKQTIQQALTRTLQLAQQPFVSEQQIS